MIEWSIAAFRACDPVRAIVVAAPPGHADELPGDPLAGDDVTVIAGGATRARSVANALAEVKTELVAIHDAARPLLTAALVEELVATLDGSPAAAGAIAAAPITDTIKQVAGTNDALVRSERTNASLVIGGTMDRSQLWAAQTPQLFRADALREALDVDPDVRDAATDEAMLVEAAGGRVLIHPTSGENLKVTTPLDLEVAELLLSRRAGGGALPATRHLG